MVLLIVLEWRDVCFRLVSHGLVCLFETLLIGYMCHVVLVDLRCRLMAWRVWLTLDGVVWSVLC